MQCRGHAFATGIDPDRQAETAAEKGCGVEERGGEPDNDDNGEDAAAGRGQRAAACGETEHRLTGQPGVYASSTAALMPMQSA